LEKLLRRIFFLTLDVFKRRKCMSREIEDLGTWSSNLVHTGTLQNIAGERLDLGTPPESLTSKYRIIKQK
jgi:hypothetical protein